MKCGFCKIEIRRELSVKEIIRLERLYFNQCCSSCYEEILLFDERNKSVCKYCRKEITSNSKICLDCQIWQKELADFKLNHYYLYQHNEQMKDYFKRYKFLGDIEMGKVFTKDVHEKLNDFTQEDYLIVPIPLSKKRLKERGFNQVEVFLDSCQIKTTSILEKKKETKAQSQKSREERLLSKQPFYLKKGGKSTIHNRKVLVIDDVYTTGRTILHAYECLLQAKPLEIASFSLTR